MDDKVVDWKGLKALGIPYSRAHIWRMMAAGDFPQAFKLGKHRNSHPVCGFRKWLSGFISMPAARHKLLPERHPRLQTRVFPFDRKPTGHDHRRDLCIHGR
ncbi:helix-turn-helix transcriptional regulator [uncultured Bradyrhizobium sp.]|uniref:helix-turn-helix transcriptional regulator n=1 Tax=uncultured Bradyrhizobium sp. TaxID=199684 RepID=UPI0035C9C56D